jgi:hypothetical protein
MRTTLDIRDGVMGTVKEYAAARSIPRGDAASDILERGFDAEVPTKWENDILIFSSGPGAEMIPRGRSLRSRMRWKVNFRGHGLARRECAAGEAFRQHFDIDFQN